MRRLSHVNIFVLTLRKGCLAPQLQRRVTAMLDARERGRNAVVDKNQFIAHICAVKLADGTSKAHGHNQTSMTRTYTLKKRALSQADTRRRIAEATLELHSTVGPANTTLSMVAQRAGVQRHTLYAHFPDEMSLFMACSGLLEDRDPPPAAEPWRGIEDRDERLRTGLAAVYAWYERNASLLACVLRDAEVHAPTRQIAEVRFAPYIAAYHEVLGAKLSARQRPMLHLALSFFTWRALVQEAGVKTGGAVKAMVQAIECARDP
jgi:AcrR family transcriptional regulator